MPIMRNPFRKQDENVRPLSADVDDRKSGVTTTSKAIDIAEQKPTEYKLSEINDSGVFIPPSPPQRKGFWSTNSSRSTTSSIHRCAYDENEQFNISRESFDSYRRSFDISARSPVPQSPEARFARGSLDFRPNDRSFGRSSLDARSLNPPPARTSNSFQRPSQVPAETEEEADEFEDVDITESKPHPPKKRGIFARMVDGVDSHHGERPVSSSGDNHKSSWHHFGARKRGQSGQGAELGTVPARSSTPKAVESPTRKAVEAQKSNGASPPVPAPAVDVIEPTDAPTPPSTNAIVSSKLPSSPAKTTTS